MKSFCLIVKIEINGKMVLAGHINGTSYLDAVFCYDDEYKNNQNYRPLSLSLPFSKTFFSVQETKNYFEGLLPEGFTRKAIADSIHAEQDDYIYILKILGKECLGAIQIIDEQDNIIESAYKELSKEQVKALAEEGASNAASLVIESHLSLTGASGKTGLYYDEEKDKWFQPLGSYPSNYIVKQSHIRYEKIILNEQLCLLTAEKLGIQIPKSFIIKLDEQDTQDSKVLFATKRYDRFIDEKSNKVGDIVVPYRLHQEDFAQVLGIRSSFKYEKNGEHYLKKMFEIILAYCENPIEDSLKLWRICVFNYFIGNTDNHIKNYSLVYSKDMKKLCLAPCYDVISTRVYEKNINEMSLSINGKLKIEEITRNDFEMEAKSIGLGPTVAMNIFDEIKSCFEKAISESADELEKLGFSDVKTLARKIIEQANVLD